MEEKMILELFQASEFISEAREKMFKLSQETFESCICMLLEEYCREHKLNITERVDEIRDVVHMVNKELGKY